MSQWTSHQLQNDPKDTSVQKNLPFEALQKLAVNNKNDDLIEPKDIFFFSKNLMTIISHNKIVTLGLLIVGLIVVNMLIGVRGEFSLRHANYIYS